jgi:5-hydroxyisourate hydrolase
MSLSVKVTDAVLGRPGTGLAVAFCRENGQACHELARSVTDDHGIARCQPDLVGRGVYRVVVEVNGYFAALGMQSFYPRVALTFRVAEETGDCLVSFVISPYSCTAYRER